jgi:hypothetical protein
LRGDPAGHGGALGGDDKDRPLAVLARVKKWAGVALLVIAGLMAVYLGASLVGELAVRVTYP